MLALSRKVRRGRNQATAEQEPALDPRLAQLLAIESDPSSSEDNREAARGDITLEFGKAAYG